MKEVTFTGSKSHLALMRALLDGGSARESEWPRRGGKCSTYSMFTLICWKLWLERNAHVFRSETMAVASMAVIWDELELWCKAKLMRWSEVVVVI
jgi:hypothetical protein